MQEHEDINRRALEAGKHVWSEKPIANTLEAGQELLRWPGRRTFGCGAPRSRCRARSLPSWPRQLAAGKLGRVAAAHADYGHEGPDWSAFFYEKLGGSMPDLGVYNLTSLTGLLGPAKHVTAMLSIVTPERTVQTRAASRSPRKTTPWS